MRIVDDYRHHYHSNVLAEQEWFGDAALPLEWSIRRAALSRVPFGRDGRELIHGHQRRIGKERLATAAATLARHVASLQGTQNFDALLRVVETAIRPITGIGELAIYDISHRIGMRLGYAPTHVHLHAGTRDGARALGFSGREGMLPLAAFDRTLQVLTAAEIEDLLCIYKKELLLLAAGKPLPGHIGSAGCRARQSRGVCG